MSRENLRGTWQTIRRLEKSIPQIKWYRFELVLMSLFVNIFALGLPIFILQVYDRVLPNLGLTTMQFLVIGLIAVMLLDFFLKVARASVTTYTGARFEHLARVSAVDHILRTPQDVYEGETPGVYLDKVNAIGIVKDFYSSQLGTLMIDLPFAVFFLGMIWFLGGVMVAVPLGLLCLFGIMAVIVGGNLRRAVDTRSHVDNRRYDFLIEIINGIHTVKAQAFKNLLQRRFEPLQEMSARAVRSVSMQSSIAQSLGSTFGQLNMACVIGTGAILVIDGSLSAGELAACTLLSGRAMQPLQSAMGLWTNFQTIRVACDNAVSVLELPAEDLSNMPDMPKISGKLEFRDVVFGYAGMEEPLIKHLSLDVNAGEMIGIDGENSSGRSTLLKLMIGLIRPTQGQVLIDGHDIAKHQSQSYRKQMGFLSAEADLYSGSILDNMTYFRGGKYISKAIKIAKQIGLDDEIKRLPEGYSTHVGDGAGGVLPAGFIQRITIIRAMVDDPKIVLFDNANHGLDSHSDNTLMAYIKSLRGKASVILVTSRPSWLRMSDRRFLMRDGDLTIVPNEAPAQIAAPTPAIAPPEQTPMAAAEKQQAPESPTTPQKTEDTAPAPVAKPAAKPTPAQSSKPAPKAEAPAPKAQPVAKPAPAPQAKPSAKPVEQKKGPTISASTAKPTQGNSAKPKPAPEAKKKGPTISPAAPKPAPAPAAKPAQQAKAPAPKPVPAPAAKPAQQAKTPAPKPAPAPAAKPVQQAKAPAPKPAPAPAAKPAQQAKAPAPKPAPAPAAKPVQQAKAPAPKPAPAPAAKPVQQAKAPAPKPAPAPAAKPVQQAKAPAPKPAPAPAAKQEPQAKAPAPKAEKTASAMFKPVKKPTKPQQTSTPIPSVLRETSSAIDEKTPRPLQRAASKSTARFTPKTKPAPKPAATLRAAPNAGTRAAPRRMSAVLKPTPPKPARSNNEASAVGGAE